MLPRPVFRGLSGGAAVAEHTGPSIPLPAHGFARLDELDDVPPQGLSDVPAADILTKVATLLMSTSAEKLGLTDGGAPNLDPAQARPLITALAGLLAAAGADLGEQRATLVDGLHTLQSAYREAAAHPEEPGHGPGEELDV